MLRATAPSSKETTSISQQVCQSALENNTTAIPLALDGQQFT